MNSNQKTMKISYLITLSLRAIYRRLKSLHGAIFAFVLFFWCTSILSSHTIFIIVHGTWAGQENWYMPGGNFYEALQSEACLYGNQPALVSFSWCGSNNHRARIQAANRLAGLIKSYPSDTVFHLIGHSHGGNIILLACKQLSLEDACIETVWTLGTPVSQYYPASMDIINRLYHCYSFDDFVQPVLGFFQRVFPQHERIINMRIHVNGKAPNHSELHNSTIAHLVAQIVGTQWFNQKHHLTVVDYLSSKKQFICESDQEYEMLAERDVSIMKMFQNICRNQPPDCNHALSDIIKPVLSFPLETYQEYR